MPHRAYDLRKRQAKRPLWDLCLLSLCKGPPPATQTNPIGFVSQNPSHPKPPSPPRQLIPLRALRLCERYSVHRPTRTKPISELGSFRRMSRPRRLTRQRHEQTQFGFVSQKPSHAKPAKTIHPFASPPSLRGTFRPPVSTERTQSPNWVRFAECPGQPPRPATRTNPIGFVFAGNGMEALIASGAFPTDPVTHWTPGDLW